MRRAARGECANTGKSGRRVAAVVSPAASPSSFVDGVSATDAEENHQSPSSLELGNAGSNGVISYDENLDKCPSAAAPYVSSSDQDAIGVSAAGLGRELRQYVWRSKDKLARFVRAHFVHSRRYPQSLLRGVSMKNALWPAPPPVVRC